MFNQDQLHITNPHGSSRIAEMPKTVKYHLTTILILWTVSCLATAQRGELIIYKGDTLEMLCEPLEIYLQNNEPREKFYSTLNEGCGTSIWRGYVGLWRIQNNRLILVDVFACGNKSTSIKGKIFKGRKDEIFAEWFNGRLFIERGKVIKYNHLAYDRCYEHEIVVNVTRGVIEKEIEYKNGVKPDDHRFSRDIQKINEEIYKRIDWKKLPKLSDDKRVFAALTLDNGRLTTKDSVIDKQEIEDIYKLEVKRVIADFPDIQVFYLRGQPIREEYYGPIIFNRQNKRRYTR